MKKNFIARKKLRPIEQWANDEPPCGIPVEQNNPGYVKKVLVN